jgi:predicted NAD-dependent protein-ADP-ribosyltransferase YbiA (DUF1768 family)
LAAAKQLVTPAERQQFADLTEQMAQLVAERAALVAANTTVEEVGAKQPASRSESNESANRRALLSTHANEAAEELIRSIVFDSVRFTTRDQYEKILYTLFEKFGLPNTEEGRAAFFPALETLKADFVKRALYNPVKTAKMLKYIEGKSRGLLKYIPNKPENKDARNAYVYKNVLPEGLAWLKKIWLGQKVDTRTAAPATQAPATQTQLVPEALNVWYGLDQNSVLSNLSPRPFMAFGNMFQSVEHGYQVLKSGTFDQALHDKYAATDGSVKFTGRKKADTKGGANVTLMEQLMRASFEQNELARNALVATGDALITHTQDRGIWKKEFPRILMQLRNEFAAKAPKAPKAPAAPATQNVARHPMSYEMPAGSHNVPNVGDTNTFDLIAKGLRTSTTRGWGEKLPKVGDVLEFWKEGRNPIRVQVTKVTAVPSKPSPEFISRWVKVERWNAEYAKNKKFWHGHQVEFTLVPTTPEFDNLPTNVPGQKTMIYAGVGSRETPPKVLKTMAEVGARLEELGYTLQSGDAIGADKAFASKVTNKKLFVESHATDQTRAIAREIHPAPGALKGKGLNLMARNTNQVFGENLDSPVDFVLAWTPDGMTQSDPRSRQTGGTGQAIDMASRKGIPVINMANPGWQAELTKILGVENKAAPKTPNIDQKLYDKIAKKLADLYPEIDVETTTTPIVATASDSVRFQREAAADNSLTAVKSLYPDIDMDAVKQRYSSEQINAAFLSAYGRVVERSAQEELYPHARLYVDMLDKTTTMNNAITKVAKMGNIDRATAKQRLAAYMVSSPLEYQSIVDSVWVHRADV